MESTFQKIEMIVEAGARISGLVKNGMQFLKHVYMAQACSGFEDVRLPLEFEADSNCFSIFLDV